MEGDIEIRQLTKQDAALFRALRLEALERSPEGFASTLDAERDRTVEGFAERLATAAVFVAFDGGAPLGMAGFRAHGGAKMAHKGMLWGMYVRPEARGRAVGRRLVEAVLAHAAAEVEIIQLAVTTENAAARGLYRAMGFVEYGVERRSLKSAGRYWDDVLMAKDLR